MKIVKFLDYIKEDFNDTPETIVDNLLTKLKRKIESMFDSSEEESPEGEESTNVKKFKEDGEKMNFSDLGVSLESAEISKYSKMYDSLTVKFSDDTSLYSLYLTVDLKEVINNNAGGEAQPEEEKIVGDKDIKNVIIKFKKYDTTDNKYELSGQLVKKVKVDDINSDFLVALKLEIDEDGGETDSEKLEIETEE